MILKSEFAGKCACCNIRIAPGDSIYYDKTKRQASHEVCPHLMKVDLNEAERQGAFMGRDIAIRQGLGSRFNASELVTNASKFACNPSHEWNQAFVEAYCKAYSASVAEYARKKADVSLMARFPVLSSLARMCGRLVISSGKVK